MSERETYGCGICKREVEYKELGICDFVNGIVVIRCGTCHARKVQEQLDKSKVRTKQNET